MPTAKRRWRVMFSGSRPVRMQLRSSSQVPVDAGMNAFDAPMPPGDGLYALGRGLLRCAARYPQCDLTAPCAGLFVDRFALDHKDLPDTGEVEVGIEIRTAPNAPRRDTAFEQVSPQRLPFGTRIESLSSLSDLSVPSREGLGNGNDFVSG